MQYVPRDAGSEKRGWFGVSHPAKPQKEGTPGY